MERSGVPLWRVLGVLTARRIASTVGAAALLLLGACGSTDNAVAGAGADTGPPNDGLMTGVVDAGPVTAALAAFSPVPLPPPPADVTNHYADDPAAAALGQKLFYDPSFSGRLLDADNDGSSETLGNAGDTGKVACAGCHIAKSGFSDTRSFQLQISLGAGWGRRRAPSLLDVGQTQIIMWDGRRDALYNQPFGPIESVVEMNSSRLYAAERIFAAYRADYEAVFGPMPTLDDTTAFPALSAVETGCMPKYVHAPNPNCDGTFHGMPGDGAEYDGMTADNQTAVTRVVVNAGKAMAAFERLLTCGVTPFDTWLHGGALISESAQRGAALFVGKAECATCHGGPFMSDQRFHNVGLAAIVVQQTFSDADDRGAATGIAAAIADPLNTRGAFSDGDDGRLPVAVDATMEGAFRTPMLRCVAMRPTFMHTGQIGTLADVVAFFDKGGSATGYPGVNELHALHLTDEERGDLVAFLQALTGPGADAKYYQATP